MSLDDDLPKQTPFKFQQSFAGRLRQLWHGVSGRWVELHQNEQQAVINEILYQQRIDLAEWIAQTDKETTRLKKSVNILSKELRETKQQVHLLEKKLSKMNNET